MVSKKKKKKLNRRECECDIITETRNTGTSKASSWVNGES